MNEYFETDAQAFLTGQLLGLMQREGWEVRPVMDKTDYTNQIVIQHPDIRDTFVIEVQSSKEAFKAMQAEKKQ